MKKRIIISALFLTLCFLLFPTPSHAYVNIIEHWDADTIGKIQENFGSNAWVIVVGSPYNDGFADVINSHSFNWVIRGQAHWKAIGQKMYSDPEGAAADWNNFFTKLNKKVYFQPWNEPTSIDPECFGDQLSVCTQKVARFINALDTSNIKLTTPSLDPHNQQNSAGTLVQLLKDNGVDFGRFEAATVNVYSPDLAKQLPSLLSQWGVPSMPIIVTESGIIVNGRVTYEAMPLCRDMFCNGVVDYWQSNGQIIGWSMFSNYQGWNLWQHQCVIDALKGDCHCETCDETTKKALAKELFERSEKPRPNLDDANVGRNWPSGATTMEANKTLWNFLVSLIRIVADEVKPLFRIVPGRGPIATLVNLLGLGSQDLVPSDRGGRFPGEDYYVERTLSTGQLELPGQTAVICLPDRDINLDLKFFPDQHPDKFVKELLNQTSIHEQVANSLRVYDKMRHWAVGDAYSDYLEYIDGRTKEGEKKIAFRGLTEQFIAGYLSRRLPGGEMVMEGNRFANQLLKNLLASGDPTDSQSPLANNEDIEKGIPIADKPLARIGPGGLLTEENFTAESDDGRVRRDIVNEQGDETAREIKVSEICCNRDHVENILGLDYNKVCEDVPGWACNGEEPVDSWLLYGNKYGLGKFATDSGVSEADWPVYLEQCFVAKEDECNNNPSFHGFFVDLTDDEREEIAPPSTMNNTHPRYTYLTEAKGECLSCQVVKLFMPQGLGALDACRHMTSTSLPGSIYEDMITKNYSQKKEFPCDVGELPNADGKEGNKDNSDYRNFQKTWNEEKWHGAVTASEIENCDLEYTTEERTVTDPNTGQTTTQTFQVPKRCSVNVKVESYMHLYITHYEKLKMCTDLYFGLLPGTDSEDLEKELEEQNGNKLRARDLLQRVRVNKIAENPISSGLDAPGDRIEHYLNEPAEVRGRSSIDQGKDTYFAGGGTEAGLTASQRLFIPASLQQAWFSGFLPGIFRSGFSGNWGDTPSEMMNIPGSFQSEVINLNDEVRQIAQEVGVPHEVPFVLWLKEGGGRRENPANGEGICGFYSLVNQGQTFPPGPISETELLRQLKLCAQEYKRHAPDVNFNTTDPEIIGWGYANYNGNVDCMGDPYPTWHDHPYVMNGYDADHMNMVARKGTNYGPNNCIPLSVIGAWPAHLRINELLGSQSGI